MAETTGIAWTRSTFNPWWGCSAVSPGCLHCYAEAWAKRTGRDFNKRTRTSVQYWKHPLLWNKMAAYEIKVGRCPDWHKPGFWPVFPSLCDPFDNEVPAEWHADFWRLIRATPNLTWLLLTKRIGNVKKMHPGGEYPNVWIGASIVNQEEADRDIPKLLATLAAKRFVSYEPALGPVDFTRLRPPGFTWVDCLSGRAHAGPSTWQGEPRIDQIIVGGESDQGGKKARLFNIEWALRTIWRCKEAGVAVFVKQLGSTCYAPGGSYGGDSEPDGHYLQLKDRAGADPAEWPEELRVQEFPT